MLNLRIVRYFISLPLIKKESMFQFFGDLYMIKKSDLNVLVWLGKKDIRKSYEDAQPVP